MKDLTLPYIQLEVNQKWLDSRESVTTHGLILNQSMTKKLGFIDTGDAGNVDL